MKILNIGLPRTGTTSLHHYLLSQEIRSAHTNDGFINKIFPGEYFKFVKREGSLLDFFISFYDSLGDLPWYSLYNGLLERFKDDENIHFVATYRNPESWYPSFLSIKKWLLFPDKNLDHNLFFYGPRLIRLEKNTMVNFYLDYYKKLEDLSVRFNKPIYILDLERPKEIVDTLKNKIKAPLIHNIDYPHTNKRK